MQLQQQAARCESIQQRNAGNRGGSGGGGCKNFLKQGVCCTQQGCAKVKREGLHRAPEKGWRTGKGGLRRGQRSGCKRASCAGSSQRG